MPAALFTDQHEQHTRLASGLEHICKDETIHCRTFAQVKEWDCNTSHGAESINSRILLGHDNSSSPPADTPEAHVVHGIVRLAITPERVAFYSLRHSNYSASPALPTPTVYVEQALLPNTL